MSWWAQAQRPDIASAAPPRGTAFRCFFGTAANLRGYACTAAGTETPERMLPPCSAGHFAAVPWGLSGGTAGRVASEAPPLYEQPPCLSAAGSVRRSLKTTRKQVTKLRPVAQAGRHQ